MKVASDLVAWWRLQHIAEEYGAVGYGQFSPLQTLYNLDPAVSSQASLDDSL
jgi:hypothetical protein